MFRHELFISICTINYKKYLQYNCSNSIQSMLSGKFPQLSIVKKVHTNWQDCARAIQTRLRLYIRHDIMSARFLCVNTSTHARRGGVANSARASVQTNATARTNTQHTVGLRNVIWRPTLSSLLLLPLMLLTTPIYTYTYT